MVLRTTAPFGWSLQVSLPRSLIMLPQRYDLHYRRVTLITVPQIRGGMRAIGLVRLRWWTTDLDFLFSALDNRPQIWWVWRTHSAVYLRFRKFLRLWRGGCRATGFRVAIIRPTGLLDPKIDVRPVRGQIDDPHSSEVKERAAKERVLYSYADREH